MVDGISELGSPPEVIDSKMESAKIIASRLAEFIKLTPLQAEAVGQTMKTDPYKPDVRSSIPARPAGQGFRFWGGIEDGFRWTTYGQLSANIKDFRIPTELRGQGIGKRLVEVWEKAALDEGIYDFSATNIKDENALRFWLNMGYVIPEDQKGKKIPYCVVKRIT